MANRSEKSWSSAGFIFLGSKITADGDCSHEIKRCLFLERKAMTHLDSVLKSRDITFPTKVYKATVFPVVMYGCENWTIKKAEHRRIDAFELWYWRRLLRVSWTARRSNQSILSEISPAYSLEGLMLKLNTLATWCEEPTLWKRPWCWERVKAGGEGTTEDEMAGWHHPFNGHEFEQVLGDGVWQGSLVCCIPWGGRLGYDWSIKQQQRVPTLFVLKHHPQASVVV